MEGGVRSAQQGVHLRSYLKVEYLVSSVSRIEHMSTTEVSLRQQRPLTLASRRRTGSELRRISWNS